MSPCQNGAGEKQADLIPDNELIKSISITMKIYKVIGFVMSMAWITSCTHEVKTEKEGSIIHIDHIVDLTHTLTSAFPFIPVKKLTYPFELIPMATLNENGVAANSWKIHEHLGTHIDAPNHFIEGQLSVDQIELEDLIVPVVVIDIADKAARNADAVVTLEDISSFEEKYGMIPEHSCVMMYSGWDKKLSDAAFIGLDSNGVKHYPGFSNEVIRFLVDQRHVAGSGVDVLSFDPGTDETYSGHKILFEQGKWGVECVANLDKIPRTGATIIAGAPKVGGATGGFSRIIAVW
jgi:kynurenine formamidase